ncbi:MAG: hypothetical protein ACKO3K_12280 [Cuspidothrix sp.]
MPLALAFRNTINIIFFSQNHTFYNFLRRQILLLLIILTVRLRRNSHASMAIALL